jgi:hypothetical protein
LILTLLIQRINVSNRIVFAFDLPIVSPEARRAVVSQLSKIFWPYWPPFFWECKGTSRIILSQNFFQHSWLIFNFFKRTKMKIFGTDCKNTV